MEEVFARMSPMIGIFLSRFDEAKIKRPIGHAEATSETVGPSCMSKLAKAKGEADKLGALIEAYNVFSKSVGREARWFTGCPCHDHIWRQPISDLAKLRLFKQEVGDGINECIWRGRRGLELARGHWKQMLQRVKRATSSELHLRLTKLSAEDRAVVISQFERMKTAWVEEMRVKFAYWDELPHCLFGMYPHDGHSQSYAVKATEKWKDIVSTDKVSECHRVTYRLMHPHSGCGFAP